MKKLTRKIVALTLSLVMCISFSNTTFAYADNENISSSAEASKVNWWKIGWIILSDYVEKLIDLDGQSEKDSSWAYLVSPSIEYNTGDMGPEVYFRPEVDMILSRLVDTFSSRILYPMLLLSGNHSIAVV